LKPLEVEDANPCMKCGSVQCAFCSQDVIDAFNGFHEDVAKYIEHDGRVRWIKYYALLKKWFPAVVKIINKEEVKP